MMQRSRPTTRRAMLSLVALVALMSLGGLGASGANAAEFGEFAEIPPGELLAAQKSGESLHRLEKTANPNPYAGTTFNLSGPYAFLHSLKITLNLYGREVQFVSNEIECVSCTTWDQWGSRWEGQEGRGEGKLRLKGLHPAEGSQGCTIRPSRLSTQLGVIETQKLKWRVNDTASSVYLEFLNTAGTEELFSYYITGTGYPCGPIEEGFKFKMPKNRFYMQVQEPKSLQERHELLLGKSTGSEFESNYAPAMIEGDLISEIRNTSNSPLLWKVFSPYYG